MKSIRQILKVLILVIVLIANKSLAADSRKPVHIGFIAPLTGTFAEWGESIRRGAQIATERTKHAFKIDYQDDSCVSQQAVTIAKKFFYIDKINLVLGPGCIDGLKAIEPIAKQANAILFSTGLLDESLPDDNKNVINFAGQISNEVIQLAEHLRAKKFQRLAIVHGSNLFGVTFADSLINSLKGSSISIVSRIELAVDTIDFRTTATRLKQSNPDVIFIHQGEKQLVVLLKQLKEIGVKVPVYSYYGAETDSILNSGAAAEGLFYSYPLNSAELMGNNDFLEFNNRYHDLYGKESNPTATSYYVYDGIKFLDLALDACEPADSKCIFSFITSLKRRKGVSGEMQFLPNGKIWRPYGIKRIKQGKAEWLFSDAKYFLKPSSL